MADARPIRRYRFGSFELEPGTGELRRNGLRIKLHAQPSQVLGMLLDRPGEILTREEICRELWPEGTFVDYEHGVNSAVNRLREALGDKASNPRFVETVARRGYRFVAPVEKIAADEPPAAASLNPEMPTPEMPEPLPEIQTEVKASIFDRVLAAPDDLPKSSHAVVQTLFVLLQVMYLAFYAGALANLAAINEVFSALPFATAAFTATIVTAALLIPVRAFLFCAVLFHAPGLRGKFLRMWPFLLPVDALWSLAPFLLLNHLNYGLALASTTLLVYAPFAQRSLILMGAGGANREVSTASQ